MLGKIQRSWGVHMVILFCKTHAKEWYSRAKNKDTGIIKNTLVVILFIPRENLWLLELRLPSHPEVEQIPQDSTKQNLG